MSTSYSVHVFYGTFVDRKSAIGRRLVCYIDKHGGTPAPTEHPAIVVGFCGEDGQRRITVEIAQQGVHLSGDEVRPPQRLRDASEEWEVTIADFLMTKRFPKDKVLQLPPIGWYIAETTG